MFNLTQIAAAPHTKKGEGVKKLSDFVHKVQTAYNENLKILQAKGMLPLFDAGYIDIKRQYLTVGVNGLVEAAEFMGISIDDNPQYAAFVQEILGLVEKYNKKYRSKELMFNCEKIGRASCRERV